MILTKNPIVSDFFQGTSEVATRLEASSVGVNVHMPDRLLDPNAESQRASCESVKHVNEVSVVRREASVGVLALEVRTSWVQTCTPRHRVLTSN